jgi:proprotein convertase subtilisin/kexin type 5
MQCLSHCTDGYYLDFNNNECFNCDPSCATCNGPSVLNCLKCS